MEETSRRGILGRHRSCDSETINILLDSIECNHPSGNTSSYCIPKVVRLKTGEVFNEKAYMSPRPPPKISLRHDWTKELGSKVDRQPEGKLIDNQEEKLLDKQNSSNQPNQFHIQFVIDQGDLVSRKT